MQCCSRILLFIYMCFSYFFFAALHKASNYANLFNEKIKQQANLLSIPPVHFIPYTIYRLDASYNTVLSMPQDTTLPLAADNSQISKGLSISFAVDLESLSYLPLGLSNSEAIPLSICREILGGGVYEAEQQRWVCSQMVTNGFLPFFSSLLYFQQYCSLMMLFFGKGWTRPCNQADV